MVRWALWRLLLPPAPAQEAHAGGRAGPPISITRVHLQEPVHSGDTDRRRSRCPVGARGPDHAQAGPPRLCPDLHAREPPALHGVKTERFLSAAADSLSSGLISKTSLFTEEKLPFTPGCTSLPLITAGCVSPRAPGQVTGTSSPPDYTPPLRGGGAERTGRRAGGCVRPVTDYSGRLGAKARHLATGASWGPTFSTSGEWPGAGDPGHEGLTSSRLFWCFLRMRLQ